MRLVSGARKYIDRPANSPIVEAVAVRRYDPEATRQAILDAAHKIFVAKGVADAPLSEIAKASGVTKSLIHHHFGSKEGLWTELKRITFEPFFAGLIEIIRSDRSHLEAIEATIWHMFRFFQAHPDVARMMTWMRLEQGEVCLDLERRVTTEGMARIAAAQAAGVLRADLLPANIQLSFIILTTGWFQLRHLAETWPEVDPEALEERFFKDTMALFIQGVLPPPPA